MQPTLRRWSVTTWMLARATSEVEAVALSLAGANADVIALQSVSEHIVEELAAAIGTAHVWALSHYPRSPLLRRSGVGLAVLTRHRITSSRDVVVSESRSRWSPSRRIAQHAVVERTDHSGYGVAHSLGPIGALSASTGPAPLITIRPQQVGIDGTRAVELPPGSTRLSSATTSPIARRAAPMLTVTFDLPWVQGDLPVA